MIGCFGQSQKFERQQDARAGLNKFHPQKAILFRLREVVVLSTARNQHGVKKWRDRGINKIIR